MSSGMALTDPVSKEMPMRAARLSLSSTPFHGVDCIEACSKNLMDSGGLDASMQARSFFFEASSCLVSPRTLLDMDLLCQSIGQAMGRMLSDRDSLHAGA